MCTVCCVCTTANTAAKTINNVSKTISYHVTHIFRVFCLLKHWLKHFLVTNIHLKAFPLETHSASNGKIHLKPKNENGKSALRGFFSLFAATTVTSSFFLFFCESHQKSKHFERSFTLLRFLTGTANHMARVFEIFQTKTWIALNYSLNR